MATEAPRDPTRPYPVHANAPAAGPGAHSAAGRRSVFAPLALIAGAFVVWLGFQTVQLWMERQQIALAQAGLEIQEQNATKLRASLDAVATSTAKLAADGNSIARTIVEELRKRGVTINPTGAAKTQ